jgi:hypothetical protein
MPDRLERAVLAFLLGRTNQHLVDGDVPGARDDVDDRRFAERVDGELRRACTSSASRTSATGLLGRITLPAT